MVTNEHCFVRICLGKKRSFTAKPRDAIHLQSRTGTMAWSDFRLYGSWSFRPEVDSPDGDSPEMNDVSPDCYRCFARCIRINENWH